jgi:hypothetical protein
VRLLRERAERDERSLGTLTGLDDILEDHALSTALHASGWSPDRAVDVRHWVDWYAREGYENPEPALEILRSFGGLTIEPPRRPGAKYYSGPILFDPEWAATGERERIVDREASLGTALWPLGEWTAEYILLLGGDECAYAELPREVLRLGVSFPDALRSMLRADTLPERVM